MKFLKVFWLCSQFLVCCSIYAGNIDATGTITGDLQLGDEWEPTIFLSYIDGFDAMNSMSAEMIVSREPIDLNGHFQFNIEFLPPGDHLLRLHIVKKGDSPTTLIIGGKDENHWFLIARKSAQITISYDGGLPIPEYIQVSNSSQMKVFNQISTLHAFPNTINYESTVLQKEFVQDAVNENLKKIADTCTNPLLALYALYSSDYKKDQDSDPEFYKAFLRRWDTIKTPYFQHFRSQIHVSKKSPWRITLYALLILLLGIGLGKVLIDTKKLRIKKLTVQERKIFELLKKGASNQEISEECHIEISTVKSHISSIFYKLKIGSRKDAMNFK